MKDQKPPKYLSKAAKAWWTEINDTYVLEAAQVLTLTECATAWDRCQQAREALEAAGSLTFEDRFGRPQVRPEVGIERDSRLAYARLMRELNLEVGASESRPPYLKGYS